MVEFDAGEPWVSSHTGCRRDRRRSVGYIKRECCIEEYTAIVSGTDRNRAGPIGAALLIETIPVTLSTEIVPV